MHIVVSGVMVSLPALVAVGLCIGFVAGMFGVGGGFILTPLLPLTFKLPMPIAVGSALCQKIGTSIGSFLKHRHYQHGELRVDFVMVGASLFGVDAGTRLLGLLAALGTFTNAHGHPVLDRDAHARRRLRGHAALRRVDDAERRAQSARARRPATGTPRRWRRWCAGACRRTSRCPRSASRSVSVFVMAYIGFATGLLSGLLGIGGGVALLPVLVYGYGFSIKDAAGTGILLLFATVLVGTFEHALRHNVDLRVALAILAGSSVGSQLGVRTTARVSNQTLRISLRRAAALHRRRHRHRHGTIAVVNRRQFLQSAAALAGGIVVADSIFEARGLTVTRHDIASATLPPELDGLRIAHLSDLHLPCAAAEKAADVIGGEGVDLVVLTGDTISQHAELGLIAPYVSRVRGRFGTIAVRGNNEHWAHLSLPTLTAAFAAGGATLLENAHAVVQYNGARLQVVGLDDPAVGHPAVTAALRGTDASLPTVWLMHAPGFIDRITPNPPSLPPALLVLAGHTHGGQIRGPGCTPVVPRGSGRFRQGFYDAPLGRAYVSRGIGTSILPLRFLCPPELPIFTLRRRAA